MAPERRYEETEKGDVFSFWLPGADFTYGRVEQPASYNTQNVKAYPMIHLPLFWIWLADTLFFLAMSIVCFVEIYPENTFIDETTFYYCYWIIGGVLTILTIVFGSFNLWWIRVMSLWTRFSCIIFMIIVLLIYTTSTVFLIGMRITYPHLDKSQVQVNADWKNAMLWIATSMFPYIFVCALQFMALWHPIQAVSALSKSELNSFFDFLHERANRVSNA